MKCPKCGKDDDKVLDSRTAREGAAIRRRRECLECGHRFTTYEEIARDEVKVIKADGRREEFSRQKLEGGIRVACQKRPVSDDQIREVIDSIIKSIDSEEVPSSKIGSLVMDHLHALDEVAYIRFASVYRKFTDVNQFLSTISEMVRNDNHKREIKP